MAAKATGKTTRVGGGKGTGDEGGGRTRKPKPAKEVFEIADAVGADGKSVANDEGKLTGIPDNFNPKTHKPLKKNAFASEDLYLDFQAAQKRAAAEAMMEAAAALETRAEKIRKFGDADTRKKASKVLKARETLKALEAELAEMGLLDDVNAMDS